jgi:hypothetical protein
VEEGEVGALARESPRVDREDGGVVCHGEGRGRCG